jgi:isoamylase
MEWNGLYRDSVRKFLKGTSGIKQEFATRLCGSQDLYYNQAPTASVNFITAHDGFSLADLVTYNYKHNWNNGEENRDGFSFNDSWNCGTEGPTEEASIQFVRLRQLCNFHLAIMVSIGTPMLLMGDEYAHTKEGNNNAWCQDNELNWFLWNQLTENQDFYRFYRLLIQFRKNHPLLKRNKFLTDEDIEWHGVQLNKPEWGKQQPFLAFTLKD